MTAPVAIARAVALLQRERHTIDMLAERVGAGESTVKSWIAAWHAAGLIRSPGVDSPPGRRGVKARWWEWAA